MGKLFNPYATPDKSMEDAVDTVVNEIAENGYRLGMKSEKLARIMKESWAINVMNVEGVMDGSRGRAAGTLIYIPGVAMDQVFKKGTFNRESS